MVARDTGTQQREDARQRYEAARQRLTGEFGDRVRAIVGVGPHDLVPLEASYEQRAAVIEAGLDLIVPLRRFIEAELTSWVDPAVIERRVIEPDDIVVDVYIKAVEEADSVPVARAFYTWLRRIARREVREAVLALDAQATREMSVYRVTDDYDEEWPDDIVQIIETLADPNSILPEDFVQRQEAQAVFARVLTRLPEQWREVFLMNVVDGWSPDEIAYIEGIDRVNVDSKVTMSREFLRSWLEDVREEL